MSGAGEIGDSGETTIEFRAEVHDNWYAVYGADNRIIAIGTWLPPEGIPGIVVQAVAPEDARVAMRELILATIEDDTPRYYSARVGHNNRLLMVGAWHPPENIENIQVDILMHDQARELLRELRARSEGPSLVGIIEGRG